MSPSPCDRGRGTAVSSETRWAVRGVPSAHSGSPCLVGVGPLWGPGRAHPCPRPSRRPVAARSTGKDRSSAALAVSAPAPCPSTSSSPCGESESREGGVPSCPPPRLVLLWPGPSPWVRPAWGSRQLGQSQLGVPGGRDGHVWGRPCLGLPAQRPCTSWGPSVGAGPVDAGSVGVLCTSWGPSLGGACGRGPVGGALSPRVLQNCHDDAAKFVHLLVSPGCSYLVQEDFVPFLQVRARRPRRAPSRVSCCAPHAALPMCHCLRSAHPLCPCPPHACPVSAARIPPPLRRIPILHLRVGAWLSAPGGRLCCVEAWLCALGGPPPRLAPCSPSGAV